MFELRTYVYYDRSATVDSFFDEVMVMSEDPALQNNRLALLDQLLQSFRQVADLSRIQSWVVRFNEGVWQLVKMIILERNGVINHRQEEDITSGGEYTMQNFPEALNVPVYDDLAHFVRDTLRHR